MNILCSWIHELDWTRHSTWTYEQGLFSSPSAINKQQPNRIANLNFDRTPRTKELICFAIILDHSTSSISNFVRKNSCALLPRKFQIKSKPRKFSRLSIRHVRILSILKQGIKLACPALLSCLVCGYWYSKRTTANLPCLRFWSHQHLFSSFRTILLAKINLPLLHILQDGRSRQ